MIPVRFLPSVSVDRDIANGILDNLVALGFIADASQLRIALNRFFAVKDLGFLVPTWNDDEGWKKIQRRYVLPLRFLAGQLAAVLADVSDVVKKSIPRTPPGGHQVAGDDKPDRPSKEALALGVLADHPEWSDTHIAKKAGCNRTTLYTFKKFMAAREILREGKSNLPRGSKFPDDGMEAWDNEGDG